MKSSKEGQISCGDGRADEVSPGDELTLERLFPEISEIRPISPERS